MGPYLKRQHSLHLSFFQLINDISKLFQFISKNSTIKLVSYIFICYHCSKLDLILKCITYYEVGLPDFARDFPCLFASLYFSVFLLLYLSLPLCFSISLSTSKSVCLPTRPQNPCCIWGFWVAQFFWDLHVYLLDIFTCGIPHESERRTGWRGYHFLSGFSRDRFRLRSKRLRIGDDEKIRSKKIEEIQLTRSASGSLTWFRSQWFLWKEAFYELLW